jgi:hypothetical protein
MSDGGGFGFGKFVPGFDFLQSLVKNAGSALPGIGQWVAPTLDPAELDKRIGELRTVHYWLEQNARMLAATIQALEVQRMTLSTLQSMNVQMSELGESLKIKPASVPVRGGADGVGERAVGNAAHSTEPDAGDRAAGDRAPAAAPPAAPAPSAAKKAAAKTAPTPAVDPMQWWGALTNQFAELATNAMKDSAADAAKSLAGGMAKSSIDAASEALKRVAGAPARAASPAAHRREAKTAPRTTGKKAAKPRRAGPAAA